MGLRSHRVGIPIPAAELCDGEQEVDASWRFCDFDSDIVIIKNILFACNYSIFFCIVLIN